MSVEATNVRVAARTETLWILVLFGALNIIDALLTAYALDTGIAREFNPLVGLLTLSGKLALVTVLSITLYVIRPRALLIPCVVYGGVVLYTASRIWIF